MAPEVLKFKPYTNKADIWSLGIVFYEMLFGEFPFDARSEKELLDAIKKRNISYNRKNITISNKCKDLLEKMLQAEPCNRIEWVELYEHPLLQVKQQEINILQSIAQPIKIRDLRKKDENEIMDANKNFYKNEGNNKKAEVNDKKFEDNGKKTENLYPNLNDLKIDEKEELIEEERGNENLIQNAYKEIEKKNLVSQYINRILFRKNVYSLIGKTIQSAQNKAQTEKDYLVQFVLGKKLMLLNSQLLEILDKKNNIDNFQYFKEFIESVEFSNLLNIVKEEKEMYVVFFEVNLLDTTAIVEEMKLKDKFFREADIKINLNKEINPKFNVFFKRILVDYVFRVLQNIDQNQKNQNFCRSLYVHINEIIDCILIDEFSFENHKDMDFNKYSEAMNNMDLKNIREEVNNKMGRIF